jgi:D-beta-D-heptose 7-phosphate kinase/D-beta-D-heptose 1-phosphate adenosyltransferase
MKKQKTIYRRKKKIVVSVSGGFDPVHIGHVRMFEAAKKLGDELVVILNNDNWLRDKKGNEFMPERERREIIKAFRAVDRVVLTDHKAGEYFTDKSVVRALAKLRPDIFANGGDRVAGNIPEYALCEKMGIRMIFNVGKGGKVQSSSWLVKRARDQKGLERESGDRAKAKPSRGKYS